VTRALSLKANARRIRRLGRRLRRAPAAESRFTSSISTEDLINIGHRLILGRAPDPDLYAAMVQEVESGHQTEAQVLASLATCDEFLARIAHQRSVVDAIEPPTREGFIASGDPSTNEIMLAKPYSDPAEATELLTCFGHMVAGLELMSGDTLLDFGAGTGWTSWNFAQLGCQVIISDVAPAALGLARERFNRWPLSPNRSEPKYLVFDGRKLDLADASVDKICCFDAFHHLVNQSEVMAEFARVLKPGGLLGFDEPGEHHSKTEQSQFEMREFGVVEGDIILQEMRSMAAGVGLEFVAADVLTVLPVWAGLEAFTDLVRNRVPTAQMAQEFANQIHNKQLFILRRPGGSGPDSRSRAALGADVHLDRMEASLCGDEIDLRIWVTIRNTGRASWLPSTADVGGVKLGARSTGSERWEGRLNVNQPLTLAPGERTTVDATLAVPARFGGEELAVNLVSEHVAWFDMCGTVATTLRLPTA
jgi:SAM-dependent methyltransferase